jgi:dihydroorotate dehydrogenase
MLCYSIRQINKTERIRPMDTVAFYFMNAAGWVKTPAIVREIAVVPLTTHIVMGSFTVEPRPGRTGGTAFAVLPDGTASNNLSLPNGGIPFLKQHGAEMVKIAHDAGKKAVISGAPFTPVEDRLLAETVFEIGADIYESNRGCPNTGSEPIAYNHDLMEEFDKQVEWGIRDLSWWRKVSPYANPRSWEIEAKLTWKSSAEAVVATNTLPNYRLCEENRRPIITAEGTEGLGGMSGTSLKPIALNNAEHFCELLKSCGKKVIGVGGVSTAEDIQDYLAVGCAGVQVGAALFASEDPGVLQKMAEAWLQRYV